MSLLHIILALLCFGGGFLIADSGLTTWQSALVLAAIVGIVLIFRRTNNRSK